MRCREFEDRMNEVLDQRLAPEQDDLLLRHVGDCLSCRRMLAGQSALFAGLELLETPQPSSQFAAAVLVQAGEIPVAAAEDVQRHGKTKWLGIISGLVSLAAVVVVAVFIGLSGRQNPLRPAATKPAPPESAPKSVDIAKGSLPKPAIPPNAIAKAVVPPSTEFPAPEREEYQGYKDAINSLTAQLPSAVEKIDEVQQATPAIRPLRASFSMAIGTLQRTIPNRAKRDTPPIKPDCGLSGHQREVVV